jgi:fatty-acid desaturase
MIPGREELESTDIDVALIHSKIEQNTDSNICKGEDEMEEVKQRQDDESNPHRYFDEPLACHIKVKIVLFATLTLSTIGGIVGVSWWVFLHIFLPMKCSADGVNCTTVAIGFGRMFQKYRNVQSQAHLSLASCLPFF